MGLIDGICEQRRDLFERVRAALYRPVVVKYVFSGPAFTLEGSMLRYVSAKGLTVRMSAAAKSEAPKPGIMKRCLGAGRPMAGFLPVKSQPGVVAFAALRAVLLAKSWWKQSS